VQVRKNYELEKKGLILNPQLFKKETELMERLKNSKETQYSNFYLKIRQLSSNLDRPPQLREEVVLARVYRMILFNVGLEEIPELLDKDYYTFNAMMQVKLNSDQLNELRSIAKYVHGHQPDIYASEQHPDFWEEQGFSYNDSTFDDLYLKTFKETFLNISTDSSEDEDEITNGEEKKEIDIPDPFTA